MESIDTFFHPSNQGNWTSFLAQLTFFLTDIFVSRWNREQSGELEVPPEEAHHPRAEAAFCAVPPGGHLYGPLRKELQGRELLLLYPAGPGLSRAGSDSPRGPSRDFTRVSRGWWRCIVPHPASAAFR